MSIFGVSAAQVSEAIASESITSERVASSKSSIESSASSSLLLTPSQSTNYLAVSAEELTFHFSEVTEAKETALEDRLERQKQVKEKSSTMKVEQIQTIMRLMEGREGYDILRGQARSFSALYQDDPEAAIRQLDLRNMSAEKKYALLNMALETLDISKNSDNKRVHLAEYIQKQNNPFQQTDRFEPLSQMTEKVGNLSEQCDTLFQAIVMQPTIKSLWDLINEKSTGNLIEAIKKARLDLGGLNKSSLESIGAIVIVHKIVSIIHSMHEDAERIMTRIGVQDIWHSDRLQRQTKMLIDLAQSSIPSTLIDKLIDSFKSAKRQCPRCLLIHRRTCTDCQGDATRCDCVNISKCFCNDFREHTLSLLYLHARQWPHEVWVNTDAKNLVLDQLLKKQNAPSGLIAKRMMR